MWVVRVEGDDGELRPWHMNLKEARISVIVISDHTAYSNGVLNYPDVDNI